MKIAYIIGAYDDPNNLKRLVTALGDQDFFIHIDKKFDINPFVSVLAGLTNVHFIKNRLKVYWGGYSQVEMLRRCLREVKQEGKYDRVVALSGMDYPAIPREKIEEEFIKNPQKEFLRARIVTGDTDISEKVTRYWKFDYPIDSPNVRRFARGINNRLIGRFRYKIGDRKNDFLEIDGQHWDIYFGSDYWALTWKSAMTLLHYLNDSYVRSYFSTCYAPSELVTQTVICNITNYSDIDEIIRGKCRYEDLCSLHYEVYDPIIQIMTDNDFNKIVDSGKMFFRKSRTGVSDELIKHLQEYYYKDKNC